MRPLDEAFELSGCKADTWFSAELYRRRGELLTGLAASSPVAEAELRRPLVIAREQSGKLFELRAATGLARLWLTQCSNNPD